MLSPDQRLNIGEEIWRFHFNDYSTLPRAIADFFIDPTKEGADKAVQPLIKLLEDLRRYGTNNGVDMEEATPPRVTPGVQSIQQAYDAAMEELGTFFRDPDGRSERPAVKALAELSVAIAQFKMDRAMAARKRR